MVNDLNSHNPVDLQGSSQRNYTIVEPVVLTGDSDQDRVNRLANQPTNLALGAGKAIGTLLSSLNGALARVGSYIPNPLPVVQAAGANKKAKDRFGFISRNMHKVEVFDGRSLAGRDIAPDIKKEFKEMCRDAAKRGDKETVRIAMENVDRIIVDVDGIADGISEAEYNCQENTIRIKASLGNVKGSLGGFLHEGRHLIQSATRSSYGLDFLNSCYKKMQSTSAVVQKCISSYERDCDEVLKMAKNSNYLGSGSVNSPYFDDDGSIYSYTRYNSKVPGIEGGAEVLFRTKEAGGGSFQIEIAEIQSADGASRVPSNDEIALFNLFSRLDASFGRYLVQKNLWSSDRQRGKKSPLYKSLSKSEKKNYLYEHDLQEEIGVRHEKEAYLVEAASLAGVKDFCGDVNREYLAGDLAAVYEVERPAIITKDAKLRLDEMGVKTDSRVVDNFNLKDLQPRKSTSAKQSSSLRPKQENREL